jgi:hypothetical protein
MTFGRTARRVAAAGSVFALGAGLVACGSDDGGSGSGGGGGGGGGGGPLPPLPDPGQVLNQAQKCLRSGNPQSKACKKVSVQKLRKECKKKRYRRNPICRALAATPGGGGGGGGGPTIPPLPLPGLGTNLSSALSSGRASPTYAGLFGFEPFGPGGAT